MHSNDRKIRQASRGANFKDPLRSDKKYMFDFLRSAIAWQYLKYLCNDGDRLNVRCYF
ncbi:hypothetical protein [Nostoc sp. 'Peltigera membranacea cyanobiont' 213]|uniref:hypothetical protein n=2 Tax=unclassified Nostoc TaxID=2593658 RepID=UPI00167E445F|nr:hypothetical protein [Nostoc sp. 'Peltigera membranacea cyanobiont' 213]